MFTNAVAEAAEDNQQPATSSLYENAAQISLPNVMQYAAHASTVADSAVSSFLAVRYASRTLPTTEHANVSLADAAVVGLLQNKRQAECAYDSNENKEGIAVTM